MWPRIHHAWKTLLDFTSCKRSWGMTTWFAALFPKNWLLFTSTAKQSALPADKTLMLKYCTKRGISKASRTPKWYAYKTIGKMWSPLIAHVPRNVLKSVKERFQMTNALKDYDSVNLLQQSQNWFSWYNYVTGNLLLTITCLTHQGASENDFFQFDPAEWVQTNVIHSVAVTKYPNWKSEKIHCWNISMCVGANAKPATILLTS